MGEIEEANQQALKSLWPIGNTGNVFQSRSLLASIPSKRSFPMRQQRTERAPAPALIYRATTGLPTNGYALIVDGQVKTEFKTQDHALKAARELKGRFPMLQVKIYDAESKRSEEMELIAA
jgi:hypothetical protein